MEIEGLIEHLLSGVLMETYRKVDKEWFTLIGILEYFREKEEHETVSTILSFLARHFRCLKLQPNLGKFHGRNKFLYKSDKFLSRMFCLPSLKRRHRRG